MWNRRRHTAGKKKAHPPAHLSIESLEDRVVPAAFTPGNLAVVLTAPSFVANNTIASVIELNPTLANQTPSNIIAIPGTGANAIRISGSATSTGYVSRTNDNTLL